MQEHDAQWGCRMANSGSVSAKCVVALIVANLLQGCASSGGFRASGGEPTPGLNTSLPPTVSEKFDAASAKIILDVTKSSGASSGVSLPSRASYATLTISYDATAKSYTVKDEATSRTFAPGNIAASNSRFDIYQVNDGNSVEELRLFKSGSQNSQIALTYVTYGIWSTYQPGQSTTHYLTRFAVAGIQTGAAGLPKTGQATYSGSVDGVAAFDGQSYRLAGSNGTLTADFEKGVIRTSLNLRGTTDVASDAIGAVDLGTLKGTGAIGVDTSRYTGTITGLQMDGSFGGAFYGPNAAETGFAFSLTDNGANTAAGVFVGH